MKAKIYTRIGDGGFTRLYGGSEVKKDDKRIEAYGSLDELNAWIGYLLDHTDASKSTEILGKVQNSLFVIGSYLAADESIAPKDLPDFHYSIVAELEEEMDTMTEALPVLKHFILPGGHPQVSICHLCRTVCRRAERRFVETIGQPDSTQLEFQIFLNRLSDYFFVLGRFLAMTNNVEEVKWMP